jgi:hypothetical protein
MAVRGSNPQGLYDPSVEWQHGFAVEGVQGMTLSNVQARETWGDGVDLFRGAHVHTCGDDATSARNVGITGALMERIGRQGLAVVDAENVTLQDSTIGPVAWADVDVETDDDCDIARHITLARNSLGANNYGAIVSVGFGGNPQVGDLTATDNTQTALTGALGSADECRSPVRILSPAGLYRDGYTFTGNHLLARRNAFAFRGLRDIDGSGLSVDVSSNAATFTPTDTCGATAGVNLLDSRMVNIANNVFTGAAAVFTADGASTGITSTGNTLN